MDLSKLCISARERNPWEAIDLGIVLTRLWWPTLFLSWCIPAAILFVPASLLLGEYFGVAYFIVWWFKPLLDRGPLYIASRQLFGETLSLASALKALPRLYRIDIFPWLTYRRLSFTRSFDMPLTVLEQLRGAPRSTRMNILHRKYGNAASGLTIVLRIVETLLMISCMSFAAMMIPENIEMDYFELSVETEGVVVWINHAFSFFAACIVAPFYAVCGFCLYISRRVDLEAWDIEIHFRHLAAKYQARQRRTSVGNVVLPLLLATCLLVPYLQSPIATADDSVPPSEGMQEANDFPEVIAAKSRIIAVLEGDDFHQYETISHWRLKEQETKEEEIPEWTIRFIQRLVEMLAGWNWEKKEKSSINPMAYIEALLWILAIGLVIFVVYRYRKAIIAVIRGTSSERLEVDAPATLFGLDVRKESLPQNVPLSVQHLWEAGNFREAVGLLYRSFLGTVIHDYGCRFDDSFTEGECVTVVNALGQEPLSLYAQHLTRVWQNLAYGHLIPPEHEIQGLCVRWQELFTHG